LAFEDKDCTSTQYAGKLILHLISGKDIPKMDDDSASDVYAEVHIAGAKQDERLGWGLVAPKDMSETDPVINDITGHCIPILSVGKNVSLRVMDWDLVGDNDEIGWVDLGVISQFGDKVPLPQDHKFREGPGLLTLMVQLQWSVTLDAIYDSLDTGDIILYQGDTSSGNVIRQATQSLWSHVSIVYRLPNTTTLYIMEASTNNAELADCKDGEIKQGVELLSLRDKLFCGYYSLLAVRQLRVRTPEMQERLEHFYGIVKDTPYEEGVSGSVELALSAVGWNHDPDPSNMFCSEFVTYAFMAMGIIEADAEANNWTPKDFSSEAYYQLRLIPLFYPEKYIRNPQPFGQHISCKSDSSCQCNPNPNPNPSGMTPCTGKDTPLCKPWPITNDSLALALIISDTKPCSNKTLNSTCNVGEDIGQCVSGASVGRDASGGVCLLQQNKVALSGGVSRAPSGAPACSLLVGALTSLVYLWAAA